MFKVFTCIIFISIFSLGCTAQVVKVEKKINSEIKVGAERTEEYLKILKRKNVGIVCNQTSRIDETHLVDSLLSLGINVKKIFVPEHGFRGNAANGEIINSSTDTKTGLPILSLYGNHKKPTKEDFEGIDLVIFDIQDVGVRFYTYLSSMHYIMEACAEQNKELLIFDRPNPNGFYVDGPVLEPEQKSFIGMHPIPVVHGMTLGELAHMIQDEGWLSNGLECSFEVIPCANYSHNDLYELPISPSPNLPDMTSIYLYPSLGFFEGTIVSIGRGTETPFQVAGYPNNPIGNYVFTPVSIPGASKYPKHENKECKGLDLRIFGSFYFTSKNEIYLEWLVGFYETSESKETYFNENLFFDKLAGTKELRLQILENKTSAEIRQSWNPELEVFKAKRKKYLLYEDFE